MFIFSDRAPTMAFCTAFGAVLPDLSLKATGPGLGLGGNDRDSDRTEVLEATLFLKCIVEVDMAPDLDELVGVIGIGFSEMPVAIESPPSDGTGWRFLKLIGVDDKREGGISGIDRGAMVAS